MAVKLTQVTLYMKARKNGQSQTKAAAGAGLSERTARRIDANKYGSQRSSSPRNYATRKDPLAAVWESELEPMLRQQPGLSPITLVEHLQDK